MPSKPRNLEAFDAWLWALDEGQLRDLALSRLAHAAAADGIELPQLTMLTVIADTEEPFGALHRAAGRTARDARTGRIGGLIWSRLQDKDYVVGMWPSGARQRLPFSELGSRYGWALAPG
jgi:hypothetical protein